jgi:GTPase SAR1 family protein
MHSDSRTVNSDLTTDNFSQMNLVRQKIVFVGDVSVGKTSIINRLNENKFKENYDVRIIIIFISHQ